jgi:hypothetical protein
MADSKKHENGEQAPGLINGLEPPKVHYEPSKELKKKEERTIHDITTYDLLYLRGLCEKNKGKSDVDSFYDFINCVLADDNVGPLSELQAKLLGFYEKNCPQMIKNALELSRPVSETENEVVYKNGKHIKKIKRNDRDSELVRIMDVYDEQAELENQLDIDKTVAQLQKESNILGTKVSVYRKAAKNSGLKLYKGKLVPLTEQNGKTCETENHDEFWKDVNDDVSVYDVEDQQSTEIYEREIPKPKNLADMVRKVLGNGRPETEHPVSELSDIEEYAKLAHETEQLKIAYIGILQTKLDVLMDPVTGMPRSLQTAKKLKKILKFLDTPKDIERDYLLGDYHIDEKAIFANTEDYLAKNKKPQN